jgi:hypothetical protein
MVLAFIAIHSMSSHHPTQRPVERLCFDRTVSPSYGFVHFPPRTAGECSAGRDPQHSKGIAFASRLRQSTVQVERAQI